MTRKQKNPGAITLGLDIGIASVGWAVLGETRIIDLGVRCFDKAETAKEGKSLNKIRRDARLLRRRLRRRAWRLKRLARLLKRDGLIDDARLFEKQTPVIKATNSSSPVSLWQLRVGGLDRCLGNEEWARVIYHLCKHRGFHWQSRAEEAKADIDKSEGGKVKQGLNSTKKMMLEKNYRTAAEMVLTEFPDAQRNKQGDYSKALSRTLLGDEFRELFVRQRNFGNLHTSIEFETAILGIGDRKSGIFWEQKPALSGQALMQMLGKCTFEKQEYRAPKASFTAERHVWLTRLNNLRVIVNGVIRPLNESERNFALSLPYQHTSDFKYKQLRSALNKAGLLPDNFRFAGLSYPSQKQTAEQKAKDPEDEKLINFPAWQELRKALKGAGLEVEWQKISTSALEGDYQLIDQIAWVLSIYKEDDEVQQELDRLGLPNKTAMIEALLTLRFDKFSNLSLKALYKIVPFMEQGLRYDEACEQAGYHHSQQKKASEDRQKYLPPLYSNRRDKFGRMILIDELDVPRNPVVLRALNQARKVVNALVKTYGSPHKVHIEMARDLSKPFDERMRVQRDQQDYRDLNERNRDMFASSFGRAPTGKEFEKWQLYREQLGKCAYSLAAIDLHRLSEDGYVEVDHALPYSRSFDDSKNNRVLVLTKENRNKGNMTPFEYLDGKDNGARWREFAAFVESNKMYRQAKRNRLLRKDFGVKESEGFRERNLNDTRYICRFFKNYVERYLKLHDDSNAKQCVVVSGQLTNFLRLRWGLLKVRSDGDRHHALDAAVVAACSHSMVKRLSDYSRRKELQQVKEGFIDVETGEVINPSMLLQLEHHFPAPWASFRDELLIRLNSNTTNNLKVDIERLGTYTEDDLESLRPVFVSRAPQRRNRGAAHKETIYAQPHSLKGHGGATQKIRVIDLKLDDIDKLIEPHRNERLYDALRVWVRERPERERRAKQIEVDAKNEKRELSAAEINFIDELRALPRKPDKDGKPTGPIVRSVTAAIDKLSGIPIRGGIARNDTMIRVDVFRHKKDGKYHLVPVYVHHAVAKELPNRAIIAAKDEDQWTLIDEVNFNFCFSLYTNDLIRLSQKGKPQITGYYGGCHRGTGNINIWLHDRDPAAANSKKGAIEGLGVKTALSLEKFNVDILGNIYPALLEVRLELA